MPSHIVITSAEWAVPLGLNVGATKAQLLAGLGNPRKSSTENRFDYHGDTEEAQFTLSNGLITRIEIQVYSD